MALRQMGVTGFLLSAALIGVQPTSAHQATANEMVEVAFVLDTTGSMGDLIAGAKRKIWSIANTIVEINPNADIRMALVGFRDFGDDYVVKKFDLSADIQDLYGNLTRFNAAGGGDTPEAVNEALHEAVTQLSWQGEGNKIIFLVGDSPPHMDYQGPKYAQIVKTARKNQILINAVQAGHNPETKRIWQSIAQFGNGEFIQLPQNGGKVVVIETPYDTEIKILQDKIDKTVIPYGDLLERNRVKRLLNEKSTAELDTAVSNSIFYSKRSRRKEVITGGGDLVADVRDNNVEFSKVPEAQLPAELRETPFEERSELLGRLIEERASLEKQMRELVRKHDDYVSNWKMKNKDTDQDSFDTSVSEVLIQQLKATD